MTTKTVLAAATVALFTALPMTASAMCSGAGHQETASTCETGQVWDAAAQTCVPTTG